MKNTNLIVNAGYFVLRKSIFDYINFGEELVIEPFQRLMKEKRLLGYRHDGFSHVTLSFGYQDELDVPRALGYARREGQLEVDFNPFNVTYYLSQMTIVPTGNGGRAMVNSSSQALLTSRASNQAMTSSGLYRRCFPTRRAIGPCPFRRHW